jgi:putative MATE family efflux protein
VRERDADRSPAAATERREIVRLAVPAFAALVSEPVFLLTDAAVIGHLGTEPLASLAIAGTIVQTVVGLCVFLAYGTTAAVARHLGAEDKAGALVTGMAGIWLAALLGCALGLGLALGAEVLAGAFGTSAGVHDGAVTYLLWAAPGLPAMLVVLAATGVLRGLQDTATPLVVAIAANVVNVVLNVALVYGLGLGLAGSALGTTLAQIGAAAAMVVVIVRAGRRHGAALAPTVAGVRGSARAGGPLVLRTFTLRAALLLSTLVAATLGSAATAAHHVVMTVVTTLAFALDALAIAGQALTGRLLGAGDLAAALRTTATMVRWGAGGGLVAGLSLVLISPWLTWVFTDDPAVRAAAIPALVVAGLVQPVSGVVFVLDGVLIGAGDGAYLARAGLLTLLAYTPLALLVVVTGSGLGWLWVAYGGFMLARLWTLMRRARSEVWLVTGLPGVTP